MAHSTWIYLAVGAGLVYLAAKPELVKRRFAFDIAGICFAGSILSVFVFSILGSSLTLNPAEALKGAWVDRLAIAFSWGLFGAATLLFFRCVSPEAEPKPKSAREARERKSRDKDSAADDSSEGDAGEAAEDEKDKRATRITRIVKGSDEKRSSRRGSARSAAPKKPADEAPAADDGEGDGEGDEGPAAQGGA